MLLLATCVQLTLMAVLAEPHYVADVPAQLPLVSDAVNGTDGQGCHVACGSLVATTGKDLLVVHYRAIPARFASSFYAVRQRELTPLCVAEPADHRGRCRRRRRRDEAPLPVKKRRPHQRARHQRAARAAS
ncbi:hypothetical protein MY11210_006318 [Beauveria gryllotalpidicola]